VVARLVGHFRHNLVGYVALFVALGGSAYAISNLPANSVGSKQLRKNAVKASKVKDRSLRGKDLQKGAVGPSERGDVPAARVYRTTDQASNGSGYAVVSFDAEAFDTDKLHSNTTNPTRLTAPIAGIYLVTGNLYWAAGTGTRQTYVTVNGDPNHGVDSNFVPATSRQESVAGLIRLEKGDYVELTGFEDAAGSIDVIGGTTGNTPTLSMIWQSP
jgi:hypothetical protein